MPESDLPKRRLDVIDAGLRVWLRGTGETDVVPVTSIVLEHELAAEIAPIVGEHDFRHQPVACGLVGDSHALRVAKISGSEYFLILIEGNGAGREIARFAHDHALDPAEAELLRLVIGGYSVAESLRRTGDTAEQLVARQQLLLQKLGVGTFTELVYRIIGRDALAPNLDEMLSNSGIAQTLVAAFN